MTWAVACFGPFAGARTNASERVHARLASRPRTGNLEFLPPLPVTFAGAWPALRAELERRPDVDGVLCLGQAAGRGRVDLECVALNYVDTDTPDNDGVVPPVGALTRGPLARWCPIPWTEFAGEPACARSYSAGAYVCNALFYEALAWAEARGKLAGFVHVPALSTQSEFVGHARVDEGLVVDAVAAALEFLVGLT